MLGRKKTAYKRFIQWVSTWLLVLLGSVQIGFEMIRSLKKGLRLEDPSLAWDPTVIAQEWPMTARKIFQKYPGATQEHACQLILLGVHPTEEVGIPGMGRAYIYSFSWPDFEPVLAKPYEVLSISSGRDELGISETLRARPIQAAVASAGSFAVGAAMPLVVTALAPVAALIPLVSGTSLAFLALLGGLAARAGGEGVTMGAIRVTFWGAMAMALTAGVGALFGTVA